MLSDSTMYKSPKQALYYHYITRLFNSACGILVLVFFIYLWQLFNWWHGLIYIFSGLILLEIILLIFRPWIKYRYAYYKVSNPIIEVKNGLFLKRKEIMKFERIQYIERKSDPILSKMQLSQVTTLTAGHVIVLPLMKNDEVDRLETEILQYLRGADYDV